MIFMDSPSYTMNTPSYIFDQSNTALTEVVEMFVLDKISDCRDDRFILEICKGRLQIRSLTERNLGAVYVDFLSGKAAHRRIFGKVRNEAIAKAVGFKKNAMPSVLDLTAGLGQDAFVLASIGCRVHVVERCNVIAALLFDGLKRARVDKEIGPWVRERLSLSFEDSLTGLKELLFEPDVVYIDAMFPEKKKSALVKKGSRLLQRIVGPDMDQDQLLEVAQKIAKVRVVVKRPNSAKFLNNQRPKTSTLSKKYRFDIYR